MTPPALTLLGDMEVADFMRDYWQKKPLLVRNALSNLPSIDPDQLAGFALEADIESRLIIEQPSGPGQNSQWQVLHGPLAEEQFSDLPDSHWTLLIQAVDQLLPEVHDLLHRFRFIPNWRVDDVMVSYAADGGGVGPHFDYYDVFLLQTQGRRHWRLGQTCNSQSPLQQGVAQKLLQTFDTQVEYTLEPGDLLYIPPRLAHWGVAIGDCTTVSVGFRAPSAAEALLGFAEYLAGDLTEDHRLADPDLQLRANPGLILPTDLARARRLLAELLADEQPLLEWFGTHMTRSGRDSPNFEPALPSPRLAPGSRAAYAPLEGGDASLFINGESHRCSLALAQAICAYERIDLPGYSAEDQAHIRSWLSCEWLT